MDVKVMHVTGVTDKRLKTDTLCFPRAQFICVGVNSPIRNPSFTETQIKR